MLTVSFVGQLELAVVELLHAFVFFARVDDVVLVFVNHGLLRLPASPAQLVVVSGRLRLERRLCGLAGVFILFRTSLTPTPWTPRRTSF
jgi:hypothetical protein